MQQLLSKSALARELRIDIRTLNKKIAAREISAVATDANERPLFRAPRKKGAK